MKALQVKLNGEWHWVFCRNERTGVVTTKEKSKALPAHALGYFETKMANHIFRVASTLAP